jgi:murein DD-endopeptidase MepM/ murein hydrolase activator NlpD
MRALAVAVLTALALSVSGLAMAASTDPRADDAPPRVEPLERLAPGWRQPPAKELLRPAAVHPVRAPVDYGEGGAQFGADRGGRMHEGQDVFAPAGTPREAVRDGVGLETGDDGGRGN